MDMALELGNGVWKSFETYDRNMNVNGNSGVVTRKFNTGVHRSSYVKQEKNLGKT
jgi:hypothetical protein